MYDGTNYCGWQRQLNGETVQEKLEDAIYAAFNECANVTASGRTDSGVHAAGQVCHVDLNVTIDGCKLADALNARLPDDISVVSSALAPEDFDANRSAKKKTYVYNLYFSRRRNPLLDRYSVWVKGDADVQKMQDAAKLFEGAHNFKAYCASGSQVQTFERTIYFLNVDVVKDGDFVKVQVTVCGNGFLYNMVRTIVGTLLYHAAGRITKEQIALSLESGDRNLVGKTMPPHGLLLKDVDYGISLF
jgi:tRNA pseudouridine38-40 synthase